MPVYYHDATSPSWEEGRDREQRAFEMQLKHQAEEHARAAENREREREEQAKKWKGKMARNCVDQKQREVASGRVYAHASSSPTLFAAQTSKVVMLRMRVSFGNGLMHHVSNEPYRLK